MWKLTIASPSNVLKYAEITKERANPNKTNDDLVSQV